MRITLKTLSALLSASGESSAHLDADVKYDKHGFPYIQAKTFKGLLRESGSEVCEIFGTDYTIVDELFGRKGNNKPGTLAFNNLRLKDYAAIDRDLNGHNNVLNTEFVKKYFTEIRQQTTIENGIAKDKSLRKYRLIKENLEFATDIENIPVDQTEFIRNALLNLRYIGTRRNRGFGKVEISLDEDQTGSNDIPTKNGAIALKENGTSLAKLSFEITTQDTLLIAQIFGEQNTVSTERYIPAQIIRGLLAGLIINNNKLVRNAHSDPDFIKIILSGEVKYNSAFIIGAQPIPKIYGYDKTDSGSKAEFIFEKQKPLKAMSGFAKISETELETENIETSFSFHSSRCDNRMAGRSTKEDGAIYYYEGIEAEQTFASEIIGSKSSLAFIKSLLEQKEGIHRMGKSKTAQYSRVKFGEFQLIEIYNEASQAIKSPVYVVFQTPVITYNEWGMAIPNVSVLQEELKSCLEKTPKTSIASSSKTIENYMSVWQNKTPGEAAFDIGTTLKIEFEGSIDSKSLARLELIGLGERKNEGYGRVKVIDLRDGLVRGSNTNPYAPKPVISVNPFGNPMLMDIYTKQAEQEDINALKLKAIEDASRNNKNNNKKLPNSLISRLNEELAKTKTPNDWTDFINGIKGKKAHKTLDEANLWECISQLKAPNTPTGRGTFETKKMYWLAFFKALRVKQIKIKENGK